MIHVQSQKIRRAFYVAGILTGMFMTAGTSADAANLMITIPSNYSSSIMGAITGSRVTTAVDGTAKTVRVDLNGDPGVFNINVNGQSTALQSPLNRTSVIPGLNSRSAVPGRLAVPRSSMQISPAALAATMKCSGN